MILDTIKRWFGGGSAHDDEPEQAGGPPPDSEMLTCQEALDWLYEFMDGELPDADADKVDRHFQICTACYPHLKLEQSFRSRLRAAVGEPAVPDSVRNRVLDLLAKEEAGGG